MATAVIPETLTFYGSVLRALTWEINSLSAAWIPYHALLDRLVLLDEGAHLIFHEAHLQEGVGG